MEIYTPEPTQNYKALIRCFTYNQSLYIEDALNGFALQQTDFPFVCLVMDDCSTDGEQDVIKTWMESECDMDKAEYVEIDSSHIILVPHKINKSCTFAFYLLKKNLYGTPFKKELINPWRDRCEYEALCEGDDYWIDPLKLQKQIDFLDANPLCTISIGLTKTIYPDGKYTGNQIPSFPQNLKQKFTLEDFCREQFEIGQWTGHTSTFCFRTNIKRYNDDSMSKYFSRFPYGDICIILCCLLQGNGIFINDHFSNYRLNSGGFNTNMNANPQIAIAVEYKLIDGMKDFDTFTEFKYHKYIRYRILRSECIIEYLQGNRNGFVFLKPKYFPIVRMQGWKTTILMILQTAFPKLYPILKKLIKG